MTVCGRLTRDSPFDAIALVEAHIHHDQEAWDAIISNADHEAVVSILVMLLNESLAHRHHLTPPQFLANMRDAFANPTPCKRHTPCEGTHDRLLHHDGRPTS